MLLNLRAQLAHRKFFKHILLTSLRSIWHAEPQSCLPPDPFQHIVGSRMLGAVVRDCVLREGFPDWQKMGARRSVLDQNVPRPQFLPPPGSLPPCSKAPQIATFRGAVEALLPRPWPKGRSGTALRESVTPSRFSTSCAVSRSSKTKTGATMLLRMRQLALHPPPSRRPANAPTPLKQSLAENAPRPRPCRGRRSDQGLPGNTDQFLDRFRATLCRVARTGGPA